MLAEVVGGWMSNSLALLADAGHMFSDAAALTVSLGAIWAASLPPTTGRTFGFQRAEVLAAAVNAGALVVIACFVVVEALGRLSAPPEVDAPTALLVATGGLLVNLAALRLLHGDHDHDLNVRGAWLHVLGDTLGSVGAIASALAIWTMGWRWADPAASLLIAALIVSSGVVLLGQAVHVLMEGTPSHLDVDEVRRAMHAVEGVREVHDLHIWTITSGMHSLTGHVVTEDGAATQTVLRDVREVLSRRFELEHTTIQVEAPGFRACREHCEP